MTELVQVHGWLPVGRLTASAMPDIDLDVPFEINDGRLEVMVPPSLWHQFTTQRVGRLLEAHYPAVAGDVPLIAGTNGRRPDIVGLTASRAELMQKRVRSLSPDMVQVAVEVISHSEDANEDAESVARDRQTKFSEYAAAGIPEYWIVDEVADDPDDAVVEIYHLRAAQYVPVLVARLSELEARAVTPPTR